MDFKWDWFLLYVVCNILYVHSTPMNDSTAGRRHISCFFQAVACVYPRRIALHISSLDNTWQLRGYLGTMWYCSYVICVACTAAKQQEHRPPQIPSICTHGATLHPLKTFDQLIIPQQWIKYQPASYERQAFFLLSFPTHRPLAALSWRAEAKHLSMGEDTI